jgi:aldehyde:ferredoxin oxidoreductase
LGIDLQTKDFNMDEKALIRQWNEMRSQIITSQVAPALVLIAILVVAAYDKFDTASDSAKFLALGVAAVTGFLATISQYAAIREGEALVIDMGKVDKPSALAKKIAESRGLLSLSAIAIIAFDVAMFALVTWAILG